jgi:hypothetical protein
VLRRFEVYTDRLDQPPQRCAGEPGVLAAFQRGADAGWRAGTMVGR